MLKICSGAWNSWPGLCFHNAGTVYSVPLHLNCVGSPLTAHSNTQTCTYGRAGIHVPPCWVWEVVFLRMNVLICRNESKWFGPQEFNDNQSAPHTGRDDVLPRLDHLLRSQSVEFTSRFKDKWWCEVMCGYWWRLVWTIFSSNLSALTFFISLAHTFFFLSRSLSYANTPPQTCKNNSLCFLCLCCLLGPFHSHRSTSRRSANSKSQCLRTITWPTHQWSIGSSSRAEAGTWVSTKRVKLWRATM